MSLESPRDLRFEGANAPEHCPPPGAQRDQDFSFFPLAESKVPVVLGSARVPADLGSAIVPVASASRFSTFLGGTRVSWRFMKMRIPRIPSVRFAKRLCR